MEEYIKMLLEQVRFQKAHKAIGDELIRRKQIFPREWTKRQRRK